MTKVGVVFVLFITFARNTRQSNDQIKELVTRWAPLIWMSPEEKYYPSDVDTFLQNVYLANNQGKAVMLNINETQLAQINTKSLYLVARHNIDSLESSGNSFLNGHNPKTHPVPTYVIINPCTPNSSFRTSDISTIPGDLINLLYRKINSKLFFTVSYWTFYPYNKGKNICFLGKVPTPTIFGRCFGSLKRIGSHVGDWEHMTLSFKGNPFPSEMFIAIHDTGGYYKFEPHHHHFKLISKRSNKRINVQLPKLPTLVSLEDGHPVLFSAMGSHGLWPAPGEHKYLTIPCLTDKCGRGVPWKTWMNLDIYFRGSQHLPKWLFFKGRWGNPKTNCLFTKLGLCEHTDGPEGILRSRQDFSCDK